MAATPAYNHYKHNYEANNKRRDEAKDKLEKLKQCGESCGTCIHIAPGNDQLVTGTYYCQLKNIPIKRYNICARHNEGMPPKQNSIVTKDKAK